MTLQNTDLFLVNRGGTSHRYSYADLRNDISVSGVTEQEIPDGAAWSLADGPFWRFTAGGKFNFPTVTATEVNMSGLIRMTGDVTSWGAGGFTLVKALNLLQVVQKHWFLFTFKPLTAF